MKEEYIITNDELLERGIDLQDSVVDPIYVNAVKWTALDLVITRILRLNDNLMYASDIEKYLDDKPQMVYAFKKLQARAIYNLIYCGDNDPIDKSVEDIITGDLKLGAINGFQKRVY